MSSSYGDFDLGPNGSWAEIKSVPVITGDFSPTAVVPDTPPSFNQVVRVPIGTKELDSLSLKATVECP